MHLVGVGQHQLRLVVAKIFQGSDAELVQGWPQFLQDNESSIRNDLARTIDTATLQLVPLSDMSKTPRFDEQKVNIHFILTLCGHMTFRSKSLEGPF